MHLEIVIKNVLGKVFEQMADMIEKMFSGRQVR